jgi:outer membrane lipoprotein-sorting protein
MNRLSTTGFRGLLLFGLISGGIACFAADLESALAKMDQAAANFRTAQANFTWTTYNAVINDFDDKQTGTIYFRRSGSEIKMAADITTPTPKQVLFAGGKIQMYQPKLETLDVYNAGTHREEFETFLVLGFGSSGEDMQKSFEVKYGGDEKIDGVDTARLDLTPKADNIKLHFPQIILWIDLQKGVSVQQKLVETNGDYRLAKYSDIRLGQKIPDKVFNLKTSGKTTVTNH